MHSSPDAHLGSGVAGRRFDHDGSRGRGLSLVSVLVGLNVTVFVYQSQLIRAGTATAFVERYAVSMAGLREGLWWQLITHLFLHGGDGTDFSLAFRLFHIGLNMVIVFWGGRAVVRRVGNLHFLGIYLAAGILGALLQVLITPKASLLGASSAAFGLVTAYAATRSHEILFGFKRGFPLRASGASLVHSIILSCVLLGLADLALSPMATIPLITQVGHFAHLGGALGGLFYCRIFGMVPKVLSREDLAKQREANEKRVIQPPTEW